MKREEFWKRYVEVLGKCQALSERKNADYAEEGDALANFRTFGSYGVIVRLSDKLSRVINLVKRKGHRAEVADESIRDTLMDVVNYAAIAIVVMDAEKDGSAWPMTYPGEEDDIPEWATGITINTAASDGSQGSEVIQYQARGMKLRLTRPEEEENGVSDSEV